MNIIKLVEMTNGVAKVLKTVERFGAIPRIGDVFLIGDEHYKASSVTHTFADHGQTVYVVGRKMEIKKEESLESIFKSIFGDLFK